MMVWMLESYSAYHLLPCFLLIHPAPCQGMVQLNNLTDIHNHLWTFNVVACEQLMYWVHPHPVTLLQGGEFTQLI